MFNMNKIFVTIVISLLFLTACGKEESLANYKAEAAALCEVFDPDNWKNMSPDLQPEEIQQMLAEEILAAISTQKMREVVNGVPNISASLRYKYLVDSISALTGETFSCPGLQEYFHS